MKSAVVNEVILRVVPVATRVVGASERYHSMVTEGPKLGTESCAGCPTQ